MKIESGQAFCSSVNLRKETHGDEKVSAVTIKLSGIEMDASLFDELCPYNGGSLTDVYFDGDVPRLQQNWPIKVSTELENYVVQINRARMDHCTIKNIAMTPTAGRQLLVSLQINTQLEKGAAWPIAKAQQEDVSLHLEPAQVDVEAAA